MTRRTVAVAVLAGLVAGCGSEAVPNTAKIGEVKGRVLAGGKPVTAGSVAFFPAGGGDETLAVIKEDGGFVTTLPAGKYAVQVTPVGAKGGSAIPKKYQDRKTSGIEVDIPAGGKTLDDIDLK